MDWKDLCVDILNRVYRYPDDTNNKTEKEKTIMDPMTIGTAKVIVGGMVYPAGIVDYLQTPYEHPEVKICAKLDPFTAEISPLKITKNLSITNVIFNPPATIVFWSDKTKTVVKCDYELEPYDPEKGIAMAIVRKMLGNNKYEYYNIFKHWLKKWDKQQTENKKLAPTPNKNTEWEWSGDMYDA